MKKKTKKKTKQPITKVLQKKCDALLTPITKELYPMCEAGCGRKTQVGHHWIEKSRSANLRYDIDNLIGLCNICHSRLHNQFKNNVVASYEIADIIVNKRGRKWFDKLNKEQPIKIKTNKAYYEGELERLKTLL